MQQGAQGKQEMTMKLSTKQPDKQNDTSFQFGTNSHIDDTSSLYTYVSKHYCNTKAIISHTEGMTFH